MTCTVCGNEASRFEMTMNGYPLSRCTACTHVYAVIDASAQVDYDSLYAEGSYRESYLGESPEIPASESAHENEMGRFSVFFDCVPSAPGRTLLDVACGNGEFSRQARARGWTSTGIDTSATAIDAARRAGAGRFEVADLDSAESVLGERFDVVTAFEFIEHTAQPNDAIAKLIRLVRPGGLLFISVPNFGSPQISGSTFIEWVPPVHLQFFERASLKRLFANSTILRGGSTQLGSIPKPMLWRILRRPSETIARARTIAAHAAPESAAPESTDANASVRPHFVARAFSLARRALTERPVGLYALARVGCDAATTAETRQPARRPPTSSRAPR